MNDDKMKITTPGDLAYMIKQKMTVVHTLACKMEDLNYKLEKLKRQVTDEVLSAMDNNGKPLYTNNQTRALAVEKQLDDSNEYHCLIDEIRITRRVMRTEEIELTYLDNMFLVGLEGVRK